MKELDPDMSIREWVEEDLDRGAWAILETALNSIESGIYHRNGMMALHDMSYQILRQHKIPPPQWVQEIRAVLERHKKGDYEWTDPPAGVVRMTGLGPKGPEELRTGTPGRRMTGPGEPNK